MTVAELIKKLQEQPQDMEVGTIVEGNGYPYFKGIQEVEVSNDEEVGWNFEEKKPNRITVVIVRGW